MTSTGPFTLREVAQMTGFSLRSLQEGCRAGTIEHNPKGIGTRRVHRVMTAEQVRKLQEARARGVTVAPSEQPAPAPRPNVSALDEARARTRAGLARRVPRRRVA
ncbi:hypothetical protein [Micromonospora sp. RV43]|uniref:hypothetical protein n=1 Tax=Micromonospora sp. RV43 TaxID=1661387 RepID=UPI0009E18D34|nr:hypothetical protein [Micromonospora sp. RV43]